MTLCFQVEVEKPYPVEVKVPVPKPYVVEKKVPYTVEKPVPYEVFYFFNKLKQILYFNISIGTS